MFSSVGFQHMRGFRGPRVQINHHQLHLEKFSRRKRWRYGREGEMKTENTDQCVYWFILETGSL